MASTELILANYYYHIPFPLFSGKVIEFEGDVEMEETLKTLGIENGYYLEMVTGSQGCSTQVSWRTMHKFFAIYEVPETSISEILQTRDMYNEKLKKLAGKPGNKISKSKSEYPVTIQNRTGKEPDNTDCCFICDKNDGMQIHGDPAFACSKPDKRSKMNNLLSTVSYLESRKQGISKPKEKPCVVCNKLAR